MYLYLMNYPNVYNCKRTDVCTSMYVKQVKPLLRHYLNIDQYLVYFRFPTGTCTKDCLIQTILGLMRIP